MPVLKQRQLKGWLEGLGGCPIPIVCEPIVGHFASADCFWTKPSTLFHIISLWTKWPLIGKKLTHISTKYEDLLTSNSSHSACDVESTELEALHI